MRKNRKLALAIAAVVSIGAFAQPAANLQEGFYRVQNYNSNRYVCVYDNHGSINYGNTSADMGALYLASPDEHNRLVDPASVCYVQKVSNKHNVISQNTSLYQMVQHYVQIQDAKTSKGDAAYKITPLKQGYTIYLRGVTSYAEAQFNAPKNDSYYWNFIPFTPNGEEYLGINPKAEMKVGDKYYKPYVIGFDMNFLSQGMKAYYVSDIKSDAVIIKEISGTVPHNTPIIVECSTTDPSANRVDLSYTQSAAIKGNQLTGQYFSYADREYGYTFYDKNTMRVLMVKNGKLVYGIPATDDNISTTQLLFAVPNEDTNIDDFVNKQCLSANSSYLKVSAGSSAELPVMKESVYRLSHYKGDAGSIVAMIIKKSAENMEADFNGDGKISVADLVLYVDYLKNK